MNISFYDDLEQYTRHVAFGEGFCAYFGPQNHRLWPHYRDGLW